LMFFFSSRRRHTRFSRDWSSDVCSSDLIPSVSDPAAVEEICDLVSGDGEASQLAVPLPVPIRSTGHDEVIEACGSEQGLDFLRCIAGPEALQAVEAPCDEAPHFTREDGSGWVWPHCDAAGVVDQIDGLPRGEEFRRQVCGPTVGEVAVDRIVDGTLVSAGDECAGEVRPPQGAGLASCSTDAVVEFDYDPQLPQSGNHPLHSFDASPGR